MNRSRLRIVAFVVLALLGAPVAMHVVLHDLHDHHEDGRGLAYVDGAGHGGHEHPIVSSAAPQVRTLTRLALPPVTAPPAATTSWVRVVRGERNVVAFGALRTDSDVGIQPLLATFLI